MLEILDLFQLDKKTKWLPLYVGWKTQDAVVIIIIFNIAQTCTESNVGFCFIFKLSDVTQAGMIEKYLENITIYICDALMYNVCIGRGEILVVMGADSAQIKVLI